MARCGRCIEPAAHRGDGNRADRPAIRPRQPRLGLDSIDALEIALAISNTTAFELQSEDPETRPAFSSAVPHDYVLRKRGQR